MGLLELNNVVFKYPSNDDFTLRFNRFKLEKGRHVFIQGHSGCGKTTFLNIVTGLLKPNQGQVRVLGEDITTFGRFECDRFRSDHFGIIFQMFNLIPYLSVVENIVLPCAFSQLRRENALMRESTLEDEAARLCQELDMDAYMTTPVKHLSIGQQQRVAIARAIIGQPDMIVADEPTSALDSDRRDQFMDILLEESNKYQITVLFVSHDRALQSRFDRVVDLGNMDRDYALA